MLAQHFVLKYARKYGKPVECITEDALNGLRGYAWPGNIRELENVIERAVILSRGTALELGPWLPQITRDKQAANSSHTVSASNQTLEEMERVHIQNVLEKTNWRVSGEGGAAEILGLNRTTLEARMKKLGVSRKK